MAGGPTSWSTVPPRRRATPRKTRWLLVAVLFVHTVAVVAQPLLAGRYLSGDVDAMGAHSLNGTMLPGLSTLQIAAAALFWRPGRGPFWPVLASVALLLAEGVQIGMGYSRTLGVHIPLGVAIVTTTVGMFVWSLAWRPHPSPQVSPAGEADLTAVIGSSGAPWR